MSKAPEGPKPARPKAVVYRIAGIVVSLLMLVLLLSACSGAQPQRESAWERCYDGALAIDKALGATTDQENGLVDVIYDVCDTRRPGSDPRGGSFAKAILDTDVVLLCLKTPSCTK
jgi:hypothetical protein